MLYGVFDIKLVDGADSSPLPEVQHNGKSYVIGVPGTKFKIQITRTAKGAFPDSVSVSLNSSVMT